MVSITARIMNLILQKLPESNGNYEEERERNAKTVVKPLKDIEIAERDLGGFPADYITKKGNAKGTVFYIHGGGFTTGSAKERRSITQHIVSKRGYDCVSINYSLAPENKWPKALEDCLKAYEEALQEGYEDLILMGESAGGTLALSLGLLLKEKGLPLPKAIVAYSPCTDQAEDLPSHRGNIKTDYMLKGMVAKGLTTVLFDHEPTMEELKDPYISPYYGDYEGLPKIFLAVSDSETLYDDSVVLYEKLKKEGHEVSLSVKHGVPHAYPMFPFMREAKETLDETFAFLEE